MAIESNEGAPMVAERLKRMLVARMYGEIAIFAEAAEETQRSSYLAAIPLWSNIVGFGYGLKWTSSSVSAMEAVRVYVRTKLPLKEVAQQDVIPDEIEGTPTDVIAVGDITAAFPRPVPGGVSGGHRDITGGTLGCLVSRNGAGRFILSNNHVLANVNAAHVGDDILEPGLSQGGAANPPIAHLSDSVPLALNTTVQNLVDAAIAELIDPTAMAADIKVIGSVNPAPLEPASGMSVRKHGAMTLHRFGTIDDPNADIRVTYPGIGFAYFHQQFTVLGTAEGAFADRGDSGALVVESQSKRPVGLLFAVTPARAFCNRITTVLGAFGAGVSLRVLN
jgi:hypothetical protein